MKTITVKTGTVYGDITVDLRDDERGVIWIEQDGDGVNFRASDTPALINALFDLHMVWKLNQEPIAHEPGNADFIHEPKP